VQQYESEISESDAIPERTDESSEDCEAASDQTEAEEEDADDANEEL
jgi:hypothetical protein